MCICIFAVVSVFCRYYYRVVLAFENKMDRLSEEERKGIQKMSVARLTAKLTIAGMSEEEVEALDRKGLMETWAKVVAEGGDKPVITKGGAYDIELEKEKLTLERQKFEWEMKREEIETKRLAEEKAERMKREEIETKRLAEEKAERMKREEIKTKRLAEEKVERMRREEMELKRIEEERAERARKDELESRRLELELRRMEDERTERLRREQEDKAEKELQLRQWEVQNELRRRELGLQEERNRREREQRDTMTERIKRYGDAMKHAMTKMPNDPIELVHFFENVETLFQTFEVPDDLKSTLLRPYVTDHLAQSTDDLSRFPDRLSFSSEEHT
jgi:hypothetical protein